MPDPDATSVLEGLLWRAWASLGLSAWEPGSVTTVIDPEALVVATLAGSDTRLVHETLDWGVRHARLLAPARLARIATEVALQGAAADWVATVAAHADDVTWRRSGGEPLTGFAPSGKSGPYLRPQLPAPAAALRHRAAVGTSARGELVRAFHPVARGLSPSLASHELVWATAHSKAQVNIAANDLVNAGLLAREGTVRRRAYRPALAHDPVVTATWHAWRDLPYGPWRTAPTAIAHLLAADTALRGRDRGPSAVVLAREALASAHAALDRLIPDPAPLPTGPANALADTLAHRTLDLANSLVSLLEHGTHATLAHRSQVPIPSIRTR
jgi:hypothetical protein